MAKTKTHKAPTKKKTAVQRIEGVEQDVQGVIDMVTETVKQVNEALKKIKEDVAHDIGALAGEIDKLNSMVSRQAQRSKIAAELSGLEDQINEAMLQNSIKDLKSKVDELVEAGVLELDNSAPITDRTFVVGREVDADGNETNPRLQFATASIDKKLQDKLVGKKVGDLVEFEEGKPKFEPVEVYTIKEVKKEMASESEDQDAAQTPENSTESGDKE